LDASDFTAALDDYRQYLRRKREAEQLRQDFDTLQPPSSSEGAGDGGAEAAATGQRDFSLKPGETIHIKLSPVSARQQLGTLGLAVLSSNDLAVCSKISQEQSLLCTDYVPVLKLPLQLQWCAHVKSAYHGVDVSPCQLCVHCCFLAVELEARRQRQSSSKCRWKHTAGWQWWQQQQQCSSSTWQCTTFGAAQQQQQFIRVLPGATAPAWCKQQCFSRRTW
jgi:hypothetical protein